MAHDVVVLQNFVDGEFVDAAGVGRLDVVHPGTGERVAVSPVSDASDVDAAMAAAASAFRTWGRTTPGERQRQLLRLADALELGEEALVEAQHRNTGQPRAQIAQEEVAAARERRLMAQKLQELEGNPLDAEQIAMFEMFEQERWSHDRCLAYIAERAARRATAAAAE